MEAGRKLRSSFSFFLMSIDKLQFERYGHTTAAVIGDVCAVSWLVSKMEMVAIYCFIVSR